MFIADIKQQLHAEIEKNFHQHMHNNGKDTQVSESKQDMEELIEKINELQNELQNRMKFEDSMRDERFARVQPTENHNIDMNESFQTNKMNSETLPGITSPFNLEKVIGIVTEENSIFCQNMNLMASSKTQAVARFPN